MTVGPPGIVMVVLRLVGAVKVKVPLPAVIVVVIEPLIDELLLDELECTVDVDVDVEVVVEVVLRTVFPDTALIAVTVVPVTVVLVLVLVDVPDPAPVMLVLGQAGRVTLRVPVACGMPTVKYDSATARGAAATATRIAVVGFILEGIAG